MATESGERFASGIAGLLVVVLFIGYLAWSSPARASEQASEFQLRASVQSEVTEKIWVRIQYQSGITLVEGELFPEGHLGFSIEKKNCHQAMWVFVNGNLYQRLRGNLCPEQFPDEQKTIVVLSIREVVIVGEDRN